MPERKPRRNRRQKHQPKTQDAQQPAPFTLQDLMREYQQDLPEKSPLDDVTWEMDSDDLDYDDFEDPDEADDAEKEWPRPGDLALPPEPSPELVMAFIDIFLVQAKLLIAGADAQRRDPVIMLSYLGCLSVNFDDINDLLDDLSQNAGARQPAHKIQELLRSFNEVSEQYGELLAAYQASMFQSTFEQIAHDNQNRDHELVLTQHNIRVDIDSQAMQHCADCIGAASSPAEVEAYRMLLFDLYHNAEHHRIHFEHCVEHMGQPTPFHFNQDAMHRCRDIRQKASDAFNQDTEICLSETLAKQPDELTAIARSIPMEPIGHHIGVLELPETLTLPETGQQYQLWFSYVAYYHDGKRHIQGVAEPHAKGFPAARAYQQMLDVSQTLDHPSPSHELDARETAYNRATLAELGLHDVTGHEIRQVIQEARNRGMTAGAIAEMFAYAVDYQFGVVEQLMSMAGENAPRISRKKANAVIHAARKAGLDEHQLQEVATGMGWYDHSKLGIKIRPQPRRTIRAVVRTARNNGLPEDFVQAMHESMADTGDDYIVMTPIND